MNQINEIIGKATVWPNKGHARRALASGIGLVLTLMSANAVNAQALPDAAASPPKTTVYLSPLITSADEDDGEPVPAAQSSISADQIAVFGDQNLDAVLRATPGTFTRDSPQNPGVAVNIRGLEGSGRVTMRIDGVRQNFRFTGHEAQGLVYVDPALLAGIDVSRGAVSGAGGAGALAGSANFRTLGVDDVLREGRNADGFLGLGYSDNGGGLASSGAGALRSGDWALVTALSSRSPDDYENGDGETVPHTGQDLLSGLFKVGYTPSAAHWLQLGVVYYDNDFTANSYTQNVESTQLTSNYAYRPDNGAIDLRANLYRSDVTMTYDASPDFPTGGAARGRVIEDIGQGFDVYNTSLFGRHVTAVYGVEYFRDDVDVLNSEAVPDRGVNASGESAIASLFSDTTVRIGMADVIIGLRYDRFMLDGGGSVRANNPIGLPEGPYTVDRSQGEFSPKLTFALNPVEGLQPYLAWSRSFRAPTISETFTGGNHPTGGESPGQSFFPNPFLEPETSTGWELGTTFSRSALFTADDLFRIKADYFRNRVEDYITAAFVGEETGLPGTHFANAPGTSTVKGIELDMGYDAGWAFGSLTYTDTESDLPSQVNGFGAQSYLPDTMISATVGTRVLSRRLAFGSRYYKVSESYIGEVNSPPGIDPFEPGYELVDLFSSWRFDNGSEVRLNIANLLDKAYTPALSTPAGGTAIDTGRGRTIVLSTRIRF